MSSGSMFERASASFEEVPAVYLRGPLRWEEGWSVGVRDYWAASAGAFTPGRLLDSAMGACLGAYLLQPWASVLAPTAAVIANAEEYLCEVGGAFTTGAHRSGGGFGAVRVRDVRVLRRNRASWSPGREGRYGRTPTRRKKPRCRNEGCSGVLTSEGLRVGRPQDVRGRLTPGC